MKKTTKVLLSAVLTIAMCVSVISGATFALFTSESSTNIAVTAGRVKVEAFIDEDSLVLYSMGEKEEDTDANGNTLFANKGTAKITADTNGVDTLTLTNVTPGDGVAFEIDVTNKSNVAIQYRLTWVIEGKLSEVLTATVETKDGNKAIENNTTKWADWAIPADTTEGETQTMKVAIELPVEVNDGYQDAEAQIKFKVEAVQANGTELYGKTMVSTADALKTAVANGGEIVLLNDIVLPENFGTLCVGTRSGSGYIGDAFTGVLDGNGYTISNVKDTLFGILDGGIIKNLTVEADIKTTGDSVAAVAGIMVGGTIDSVTVKGAVIGDKAVGGLVGRMLANGVVSNCVNEAAVTSTGSADAAGGIVGKAYYTKADQEMTISDCTNTGVINGGYAAGGIAGFSAANIVNCANTETVTCTGTTAGGIVGEQTNYGEIKGNVNSADISATGNLGNAGGIIGWLRYQNNSSYVANEIVVISDNENSGSIDGGYTGGGIVGLAYNQAIVTGNYSKANSIHGSVFASGIVGGLQVDNNNLTITTEVRFAVTENTTYAETITGNNTDDVAYNNGPYDPTFAKIENNTIAEKVSNADDLNAALANGGYVVLTDNVANNNVTVSTNYGATGYSQTNGGVLDGNGNTMTVTGANGTWGSAINTTGGTIKNITVTGAFRGIFINHNSDHSEKVILENVTIDGTTYTISCDQGTNQGLKATECTFNGWTSYAETLGNAEFINCSFGEGSGYAYCRPYAPTTFTNCHFEEGFEMDAQAAVTLENCYLNGDLITDENVGTLVTSNVAKVTVSNTAN